MTCIQDLKTQLTQLSYDISKSNETDSYKSIKELRDHLTRFEVEQRMTKVRMEQQMDAVFERMTKMQETLQQLAITIASK